MFVSNIRSIFFSAIALTVIASCTSATSPAVLGSAINAIYAAPATYQDHRDQQQTFETQTGQIAYTDHGEGPVLVLLHGVPTSSWMYRKIIPDLQKKMRVISIDHLGFGSSNKPESDTGYAPQDHAVRARELLSALDVSEYSLLMHDMGGLVAWEMLRADQNAVKNLVVLNTIVNDEGFEQPDMKPGAFTRTLMDAYSSPLTSVAVLTKTFNDLGLTGEHELSEAECYGYVAPMREGADPALYQFFTSINAEMFDQLEDNKTRFADFQGQTLIMWGAQDETLTVAQVPILQEMLNVPTENVHIYQDNAHFLAEEIPGEIVKKVAAFIAP